MTPLDLEHTFLSLDGAGGVAVHPVGPDFWATIEQNQALLPTLVSVFVTDRDWPHWEMHPAGVEVLVALEGTMTMILEIGGAEQAAELPAGRALVVPAGAWHRALVPGPCRLLAITYGEGTQHRPV